MTGPGVKFLDEREVNSVGEVLRRRELSRYRFGGEASDISKTLLFERTSPSF